MPSGPLHSLSTGTRCNSIDTSIDPLTSSSLASSSNKAVPYEQSITLLFETALRKYVRECETRGMAVSMDVVHNISIRCRQMALASCHTVAQNSGARNAGRRKNGTKAHTVHGARKFKASCSSMLSNNPKLRDAIIALIVKLWVICRSTPYFMNKKRISGDSFRAFVAGMMYAFKRGVFLTNGAPIVPKLVKVSSMLPTLRSATLNTPMARSLQASSHRGLCTLHKCVASCGDNSSAIDRFSSASKLAQRLSWVAG